MTDFAEKFRPRFHFSPRRNWCNDPNGLVWFDGEYHLFFQYNPHGDVWGHMSWGHAVSTDLLHWTELPVAIAEDADGMIFSGSAVYDHSNSSGLAPPGQAPLVAIYTRHKPGTPQRQSQCLAFSIDRGRSWSKYDGNPVLDVGLEHFRDPKVFWHALSAAWVMIVARSDQNAISLYGSPDLKHWRHLSDFGPAGGGGKLWECPDLFALPVPGGEKWVLKVDMFEGGICGGSAAQYFVGTFDGVRFLPDQTAAGEDVWNWADFGKDFYAAVTWANLPPADNRRLWIGWMSAHDYAADLPTSPWRGVMTLPRSLALQARPQGWTLIQQPMVELQQIRGADQQLPDMNVANGEVVAASWAGGGLELKFTLDVAGTGLGGVVLRWSSGDELMIGIDCALNAIFVDRSRCGLMNDVPAFTGRRRASLAQHPAGTIDFQVILDACSVELFADHGAVTITEVMFPREELSEIAFYAQAGSVVVSEINLCLLKL